MRLKLLIACFLIWTFASNSVQGQKQFKLENFTVEAAPEWTDLFYRNSGWFGADGIFSIALHGNEGPCDPNQMYMLYFSDTYIGDVEDGKPKPGYKMVNNSVAYLSGCEPSPEKITFQYNRDSEGTPSSYFVPKNSKAKKGQYYWLGDGFVNKVNGDTMYIFAYHVEMTGSNVFDFKEPDVSILLIPPGDQPPFKRQQQIITPLHIEHPQWGPVNFGAGIFVNTLWAGAKYPDGFIYIYGCMDKDKKLVVARTPAKLFTNFKSWQYYDGKDWQSDPLKMAPITTGVSNELSISTMPDGRLLLVYQAMGISETIAAKVAHSPEGPFGEQISLYRAPEIDQGLLPYNAKGHPVLSKEGELLISYNTITFDFWNDIQKDAHIYRPRFIKLKFDTKK